MSNEAPPLPAVQTNGLSRNYGSFTALSNLNLTVNQGDLFGFIGSNGAGKTTTLRILSTFLTPSTGSAQILGHDVVRDADAVRHVIGYMPDFFGVYKDMEVTEYLDFFGACYRIPTAKREKTVNDVLELVGLSEKKGALIGALSRGMQQRLGLARVLIHDPKLLLLDEPASGLDPRARIEIRQLLKKLKDLGKTILVSSHILPELASTCDRVGIIEQGKLLLCDRVDQVLKQVEQREIIEIELLGDAQRAAGFLKEAYPSGKLEVREVVGRLVRVAFEGDEKEVAGLLTRLVQANHAVVSYREEPLDLEKVYLKVTEAAKAGARKTES